MCLGGHDTQAKHFLTVMNTQTEKHSRTHTHTDINTLALNTLSKLLIHRNQSTTK